MPTIFFTGVPGFLGTALLPRVLSRDSETEAVCLVQPRFADLARQRVAALERDRAALKGRIRLVEGDITEPDLGLAERAALTATTSEIYHLAAVYDLSVRREVGMRINVTGTRHMLDFAADCANLTRFHYVSTCYVSGRYTGIFTENDLDKSQVFNNYYEETKFLAECDVQRQMRSGLPATIYRPSIVVGDSRTGETQKYDGPYVILRLLLRQPRLAIVPIIGDPTMTRINIVPQDFVVNAITYLSGQERSRGKIYHLADPAPLTVDETLMAMARATGRGVLRVPVPRRLAEAAITYVPGVKRLMQVPASALAYFVHPTHYTTANADADLASTDIRVPPFPAYLPAMTDFVRRHPEIGATAMI